jgi:hypothetical protein
MIGRTLAAKAATLPPSEPTAQGLKDCRLCRVACLGRIAPVPQQGTLGLAGRQRHSRPLRYEPPLLLGDSSVEVQHERICIRAQLGDDEWHPLGHQPSYEGDIAGSIRRSGTYPRDDLDTQTSLSRDAPPWRVE